MSAWCVWNDSTGQCPEGRLNHPHCLLCFNIKKLNNQDPHPKHFTHIEFPLLAFWLLDQVKDYRWELAGSVWTCTSPDATLLQSYTSNSLTSPKKEDCLPVLQTWLVVVEDKHASQADIHSLTSLHISVHEVCPAASSFHCQLTVRCSSVDRSVLLSTRVSKHIAADLITQLIPNPKTLPWSWKMVLCVEGSLTI